MSSSDQESQDWIEEACIAIRGPRSAVEEAHQRLSAFARTLKGVRVTVFCDSTGDAKEYDA